MCDRDEFEKWISEFLGIDPEKLKRCRGMDNEGLAGYEGLEQEGCSDDADDMATLALQSWQAARAQQVGSGAAVAAWNGYGAIEWLGTKLRDEYWGREVKLYPQPAQQDCGLLQRSEAWLAVVDLLKEVTPAYKKAHPGTGKESALAAIRGLAQSAQQGSVPEGWRVRLMPYDTWEAGKIQVSSPDDHHCMLEPMPHAPQHHPVNMFHALAEALLATTPQPGDEGCEWHGGDNGTWMSACGLEWYFEDGGPEDNGMNYCVKCWKPCVEIGSSEDGGESCDNAMGSIRAQVPKPPAEGAE